VIAAQAFLSVSQFSGLINVLRRRQLNPTAKPGKPRAASTAELAREAVGTFHFEAALEAAVSELASAGWDRARLSILAAESVLAPHLPVSESTTAAADDPQAPRGAVVSDTDMRQGRTLASSMAGVIAALGAAGAVVVTGGGALAAVVGAAAVGGGVTAAAHAAGRWLNDRREKFLEEQIERGGILLWVALRDPGEDRQATDILRRHGAADVHVHEIDVEAAHAPLPDGA
jgi:hypothetical protein